MADVTTAERWIALALLAGGLASVVPTLRKGPVRREARAHPLRALAVGGVAIATIGVLVGAAARTPWALRLLTASTVAMVVLAWMRARSGYGARRGLPPGSLGWAASLDAIDHQDFYARAARRWGPIFKMRQFHQPVVCIAHLQRGFDLLRDEADGLAQVPRPWARVIPGGYIEFMDGHHHEHYREIFRRGLSGRVLSASKDAIATTIRQELSALARRAGIDLARSVNAMASESLLRVFFGLAPDSPDAAVFQRHLAGIDRRLDFRLRVPRALETDVARLAAAVRRLADAGGAPASVVSELARTSPDVLADDTVVRNLIFMTHNARKSLAGMLCWLAKLSADHPRWMPELRREHEAGGDALATRFTSELFRLWQSEYVYRRTLRECRIGEFRIPKGWLVRLCVREAHGRADLFPDPAAFDPGRFVARAFSKYEYAPFSDGPHACFGAALTFTVARIFLHEMAAGFDARTIRDGPVERGNNHWVHWQPSADLRIALTPR